jgi:hypothetical protein
LGFRHPENMCRLLSVVSACLKTNNLVDITVISPLM